MWIMCSYEPLSPDQLVAGAVLGLEMALDSPRARDDRVDLEIIIHLCHNLVVLDQQLDVVRFAHLSVLEYLEKRRWDTVTTNTMAAEVCIYALNDPTTFHPWLSENRFGKHWMGEEGFLFYSTNRWQHHFQRCGDGGKSEVLAKLLTEFLGEFDRPTPAYVTWFRHIHATHYLKPYKTNPPNSMMAAAAFGVGAIVAELWETPGLNPNLRAEDHNGTPALQLASRYGHEWVVRKLLERGADPSLRGGYYGDSLQAAAYHGHTGIVKLLLEKGASCDTQQGYWGSPLQAACYTGCQGIICLLLESGANINMLGGPGGSPLLAAASSSSPNRCQTIALLLAKGADIYARGPVGSILEVAAFDGQVDVIHLLVSEFKSRGVTNHSAAACSAVRANSLQCLRAIVDAGGEIHIPESEASKTPLYCSIVLKSTQMMEFIMSYLDSSALAVNLRDVTVEEIEWARHLKCFPLLESVVNALAAGASLPLSPRDLLRVRMILSKGLGLPIGVTDTILNLGEYWVRTTVTLALEVVVDENSPEEPYITIPVRSLSTVLAPVRKIVFHITSHDQGRFRAILSTLGFTLPSYGI